jgi:hypothetical protein
MKIVIEIICFSTSLFCLVFYAYNISFNTQHLEIVLRFLLHAIYIYALLTNLWLFGWITIISYLSSPLIAIKLKGMKIFKVIWNYTYYNTYMFTFIYFFYPDLTNHILNTDTNLFFFYTHIFQMILCAYDVYVVFGKLYVDVYLYLQLLKLIHKILGRVKVNDICVICQN